jgi:hypothetical protein
LGVTETRSDSDPTKVAMTTEAEPSAQAVIAEPPDAAEADAAEAPAEIAIPEAPPIQAPPALRAPEPAHRHPNLGKAPEDMRAGFPVAADAILRDKILIAARALEVAMDWDPTIAKRCDEQARASLLRDAELLTERLAMCISSDDPRWLAEYAEWIGPIYRRRGVPLADLAALAEGIRVATTSLAPGEAEARDRALDAAAAVLRKNGRLAGDRHKRNALLRWLYRGV